MTSEEIVYDDEWENRQLCSDGNCIGVIGPDGRCKECGKPAGDPDFQVEDTSAPADETAAGQDETPPAEDAEESAGGSEPAAEGEDDDWANRRLCPDGNCIGVIGPDGKCKECGRDAE